MEKEPFLIRHSPGWKHDTASAGVLALLLLVFRYRVFSGFTTHFLGGAEADAGLYVWLTQTSFQDLLSRPWFTSRAFYPYGLSLAWSDNFLLPSLLARPFILLGVPLEAVYNTLLIGAAFFAGFSTYRLAFILFGSFPAALFAGIFFMLNPFTSANLGHPQLQFTFFFPMTALFFLQFAAAPSFRSAAFAGLTTACAFFFSIYHAVYSVLLLGTLLAGVILLRPGHLKLKNLMTFFGGVCTGLLPLIPFIPPYLQTGAAFGRRALYEAFFFSASLESFLSASPWSSWYSATSQWSHAEAHFFPGVLIYLLAAASFLRLFQARPLSEVYWCFVSAVLLTAGSMFTSGVLTTYLPGVGLWLILLSFALLLHRTGAVEAKLGISYFTNRDITGVFALIGILSFVVSFGPLGFPEKGEISLAPFAFFHAILPGFDSLRAVARIGVLFHFSLAILSAGALSYLVSRRPPTAYLIPILALFMIGETDLRTYPLDPLSEAPPVFKKLQEEASGNDAVIVLPLTSALRKDHTVAKWSEYARMNVAYMLWASASDLNLVNGYSGLRTRIMREFPRRMRGFPDNRSVKALRQIAGLKYVIYSPRFAPDFDPAAFEVKITTIPGLKLVHRDDQGNYLLELQGEGPVGKDFKVFVPPQEGSGLSFSVKVGSSVKLRIFEMDRTLPLWEMQIPPDGKWHSASMPLTESPGPVIPRVLRFTVSPEADIFLDRIRWAPR